MMLLYFKLGLNVSIICVQHFQLFQGVVSALRVVPVWTNKTEHLSYARQAMCVKTTCVMEILRSLTHEH